MTVLLAIFGPDTVHLSTLDIGQRKFYKKYLPDLKLILRFGLTWFVMNLLLVEVVIRYRKKITLLSGI